MKRLIIVLCVVALALICGSCQKDIESQAEESNSSLFDGSGALLSGASSRLSLESLGLDVVEVKSIEGGFFAVAEVGSHISIELEQNDDDDPRYGSIFYVDTRGEEMEYEFVQATRGSSSASDIKTGFIRTYGVGYSYDGVTGKYSDYNSVMCQIFNASNIHDCINVDEDTKVDFDYNRSYSYANYVHAIRFNSELDIDLGIYSGDIDAAISILEYANKYSIYLKSDCTVSVATHTIDLGSVEFVTVGQGLNIYDEMERSPYTYSFRNAVKNLEADCSSEAIATFVAKYGTHVVYQATVGAKVELESTVDMSAFTEIQTEEEFSAHAIELLFDRESYSVNEQTYDNLQKSENSYLSVKGGVTSLLNAAVINPSYSNNGLSKSQLTAWQSSVIYDKDDYSNGNVEMVDIELVPIWTLLRGVMKTSSVADAIENYVTATATLLQDLYGTQHFVSTTFDASYSSVTTTLGGSKQTFSDPKVVNIIAANRYVASVCQEWIPDISTNEMVWVAYPIYDRTLHDRCGVAIHNGVAYSVSFCYQRYYVESLGETSSNRFYLTNGVLSTDPLEDVEYLSSTPVIGYEWPGSIDSSGSIAKSGYIQTRRFMGDFYLSNSSSYSNLPNWTRSTTTPSIDLDYYTLYSSLFTSDDTYNKAGLLLSSGAGLNNLKNRMVMDGEYEFFLYSSEVSY